jgi:hypothetical protein
MRRFVGFLLSVPLTGILLAQTSPQPGTTPATPAPAGAAQPSHVLMRFTPGTQIRAQLEKPIDVKKAKVGDEVSAKTTDDLNSTPPGLAKKGCRIIGHLVAVSPHQGDAPSTLGIAFDKMILKDGSEMPMTANIQAIGFAVDYDPSKDAQVATNSQTISRMGGGPGGSGTQPGGVIGSGGGDPSQYAGGRLPGGSSNNNPDAKLPFNAKGAIGMSGVSLDAGSAQNSVLTAKKHNVKLENGMQMILLVTQ